MLKLKQLSSEQILTQIGSGKLSAHAKQAAWNELYRRVNTRDNVTGAISNNGPKER